MIDLHDYYGNDDFIQPAHSPLTALEMLRLEQVKRELPRRSDITYRRLEFARWLYQHGRLTEWTLLGWHNLESAKEKLWT